MERITEALTFQALAYADDVALLGDSKAIFSVTDIVQLNAHASKH